MTKEPSTWLAERQVIRDFLHSFYYWWSLQPPHHLGTTSVASVALGGNSAGWHVHSFRARRNLSLQEFSCHWTGSKVHKPLNPFLYFYACAIKPFSTLHLTTSPSRQVPSATHLSQTTQDMTQVSNTSESIKSETLKHKRKLKKGGSGKLFSTLTVRFTSC